MSFFKKKLGAGLGALVPGEGARSVLQNVLTVEWEDHKTVLVKVPEAGPSLPSNEVEMNGLGRDYANYGRLGDDDEDRKGLTSFDDDEVDQLYFEEPKLPVRPHRSHTYQNDGDYYSQPSKSNSLPPLPSRSGGSRSNNPFDSPYDLNPSQQQHPGGGMTHSHSYSEYPDGAFNNSAFDSSRRGERERSHTVGYSGSWATFEDGEKDRRPNPWSTTAWTGRGDMGGLAHVKAGGITSPSSSTSTRMSKDSRQMAFDDDPFR